MNHIQATNISIEDWDGNLTISALYCPPRHKTENEEYNAFIKPERPKCIYRYSDR
jgi:hypothetical protein